MYYVYGHKTNGGKVFYVGKGMGDRMHKTANRSVFWKRVAKKHGWSAFIIEKNLVESMAYEREIFWIYYYKSLGECQCNMTQGGDGVRVKKRWWGEKIGNSLRGIKRPNGKNSQSYKDFATFEELSSLYLERGLSTVDIAKLMGVSIPTVCSRLKQYKIKIRPPGKSKKRIQCVNDGKIFESMSQAAKFYNLHTQNIRKVLNGKYKTTGRKVFKEVNG